MFRRVMVLLYENPIGTLSQDEQGFHFCYFPNYQGLPVSLSLPVEKREFHSKKLFPYFVSLAPEGWLKMRFGQTQNIDEKDLFGLLIENGKNLIGAVQLIKD